MNKKALIDCAVTEVQLNCAFVCTYTKSRFSHDKAQIESRTEDRYGLAIFLCSMLGNEVKNSLRYLLYASMKWICMIFDHSGVNIIVKKKNTIAFANIKGLGRPAHLGSLISIGIMA